MRDVRPWHHQCVQRCPLKGRLQVAGEAGKRVPRRTPLDPPCRRAEGCVTSQERVYRPPSILHRQLHDLGKPMVPAGIHIFSNLDHVLHKELSLGTAPG